MTLQTTETPIRLEVFPPAAIAVVSSSPLPSASPVTLSTSASLSASPAASIPTCTLDNSNQPLPSAPPPGPPTDPNAAIVQPSFIVKPLRKYGKLASLFATFVFGIIATLLAQQSNVLSGRSNQYSLDSLELAKWTAQNDYRELCLSLKQGGSPLTPGCEHALVEPLSPPPVLAIDHDAPQTREPSHSRRRESSGPLGSPQLSTHSGNVSVGNVIITVCCVLTFIVIVVEIMAKIPLLEDMLIVFSVSACVIAAIAWNGQVVTVHRHLKAFIRTRSTNYTAH